MIPVNHTSLYALFCRIADGALTGPWLDFTGKRWWFDTNHTYRANRTFAGNMIGLPVVGDFDGDGHEDLATWADDTFRIDLSSVDVGIVPVKLPGLDGKTDAVFHFGFAGARERPVAADIDGDGIDDLGLWVPDSAGAVSANKGQFFLLVSDGRSLLSRLVPHPDMPGKKTIPFTPPPFGSDQVASFGSTFALPLIGNFDPPLSDPGDPPVGTPPMPAPDNIGSKSGKAYKLDVNANGLWNGKKGGDMAYGFLAAGDQAVIGDWDGDGYDEIGAFRPGNGKFFLDANGNGKWDGRRGGDLVYNLRGKATDKPVAGDFNGGGVDEVGLHRGTRVLVDFNGDGKWSGAANGDKIYTAGAAGDTLVVGDWNGDGTDDLGVYRPANKTFYLDANGSGVWDAGDAVYRFIGRAGTPIAGDWDGDGIDEIGLHAGRRYYLDVNGNGKWNGKPGGDMWYAFGRPDAQPLVGCWEPPAPLMATGTGHAASGDMLTPAALAATLDYAVDVWSAANLSAAQRQALRQLDVRIADLPGARLGQALGTTITLDVNAAGSGWFVDSTPSLNEEFAWTGAGGQAARTGSAADGRFDLVTAVMHEIGHALGYGHDAGGIMHHVLAAGTRLLCRDNVNFNPRTVDAVFARDS